MKWLQEQPVNYYKEMKYVLYSVIVSAVYTNEEAVTVISFHHYVFNNVYGVGDYQQSYCEGHILSNMMSEQWGNLDPDHCY